MQALLTVSRERLVLRKAAWILVAISIFGNGRLEAQYTSPGAVGTTTAIPDKDLFDDALDRSPWNLGAVRVLPWYGLRDAAFVSNRDEQTNQEEDDFTLTVGAGLRAYLQTGKLMWTAHALPEYVWWQDAESKRGTNGRYGFGLFGYFNRLRFEASQRRIERQDLFSTEVQELTSTAVDSSRLSVEIDVTPRLTVYGLADLESIESKEVESSLFPRLDRDEDAVTVGVRFASSRGGYAGLGVEDRTVEFADGARDLSSSGTTELVEIGFDGTRFDARINLAFEELEGEAGSDFGRFDETTGALEMIWTPSSRVALLTYARREQAFSIALDNAYILTERQGVRFNYSWDRSLFGIFTEVGEDELASVGTLLTDRIDDVSSLGIDARIDVSELFSVSLFAIYTDYDSNLDQFDRDFTSFGLSVQLGSLIEKLRLGQAAGDW